MNQEEIKGKWENIKGNVKNAFDKVSETDRADQRDDLKQKDFSGMKDTAREKLDKVQPELTKIKNSFTNKSEKPDISPDGRV